MFGAAEQEGETVCPGSYRGLGRLARAFAWSARDLIERYLPMGSKRNLVRFLAMLMVLTVLIATPLVANTPSNVASLHISSAFEPADIEPGVGVDSCSLRREAQCNLYAFNANDSNAMLRMATA